MTLSVIYDHQIFSLHRYGGISRYFYEIANLIAKIDDTKVDIFSPLYVNDYFKQDDPVSPTGFHVHQVPKSRRIIRALNNIASLSLKLRNNVDIFHETYYSEFDFCPHSAKRIVTVYDMIHERLPDYFHQKDNITRVKMQCINRADHVICISENTRKDLIELTDIPEEKTSVVYLGYALTNVVSATLPKEKPYILYVGHRDGYKNFEMLLNAYACSELLKNKFDLICFGGGKFSTNEQALFQKCKISPSSVKHISGSDDVLASLYTSASVFVYPSLYEGFGIPPLEAMSFNCPVVCSNTSSIPEVVGDAAELFDPVDITAIQQAIERVLSSPEHSANLVSKGHERIKQFGWDKCARDTLNVYRKVLQG